MEEFKYLLYIDILGFSNLTKKDYTKVKELFSIIDSLNAHKHFDFQTVVFSDTILIFNKAQPLSSHDHEYILAPVGVPASIYKHLKVRNAPVWSPDQREYAPTLNFLNNVSTSQNYSFHHDKIWPMNIDNSAGITHLAVDRRPDGSREWKV